MTALYWISAAIVAAYALGCLFLAVSEEILTPPGKILFLLSFIFSLLVSWLLVIGGMAFNELENSRAEQVEVVK